MPRRSVQAHSCHARAQFKAFTGARPGGLSDRPASQDRDLVVFRNRTAIVRRRVFPSWQPDAVGPAPLDFGAPYPAYRYPRPTLPVQPHGCPHMARGQGGPSAIPSLYGSFIRYSMPAYPGASRFWQPAPHSGKPQTALAFLLESFNFEGPPDHCARFFQIPYGAGAHGLHQHISRRRRLHRPCVHRTPRRPRH